MHKMHDISTLIWMFSKIVRSKTYKDMVDALSCFDFDLAVFNCETLDHHSSNIIT